MNCSDDVTDDEMTNHIADLSDERRENLFSFVDSIGKDQIDTNEQNNNEISGYLNDLNIEDNSISTDYVVPKISGLRQDLSAFLTNNHDRLSNSSIKMCSYHINTSVKESPFVQYFLFKRNMIDGDIFELPSFPYKTSLEVITKSITIMELMSKVYYCDATYSYKGFEYNGKDLYLFFDCSSFKISSANLTKNHDLWLVLVDEIINHKSVCGIGIDPYTSSYFESNQDLLYITNKTGNIYESPIVAYTGCNKDQYEFESFFGSSPGGEDAILGNYSYFTDFSRSIKNCTKDKDKIGGIVRYAIFPGDMKIKLNGHDDPEDDSHVTYDMLSACENNTDAHKQLTLTMRLADRSGCWAILNDSVYIGDVELDDGSRYDNAPLWCLKRYEQQCVMSCHLINKNSIIGDNLEDECEFAML